VDDDALLLDYLVRRLGEICPPGATVLKAGTGVGALRLAKEHAPEVAILDLGLPDRCGFSVAADLAAHHRSCKILLVSGNFSEAALSRMGGGIIHGCLTKASAQDTELKHALGELTAGRRYFPGDVRDALSRARNQSDHFSKILSLREMELLPLLGYGWTNERIASYVGLSAATVRTHRQNILTKLGLHGREELMRWAIKKGFSDFRYEPAD
jgi:DNA-binding NarL/FixJ family response regulator